MKFAVGGHASIDRVIDPKGNVVGTNLGGPCLFAYTGIRVFDDNVKPILNSAADFTGYYGEWMTKNHVDDSCIKVVFDKTHAADLIYSEDGSYDTNINNKDSYHPRQFNYGWANLRPEQIEAGCMDVAGFCLFVEPTYDVFWQQLHQAKSKCGFQMMWEIGSGTGTELELQRINAGLRYLKPEMASLNHNESSKLFKTDNIEKIFEEIYKWDLEMFFYRCGNKGSYILTDNKSYFVPVIDIDNLPCVDPTGCGNSSTAASMYGWIKTKNPVMTAIIANISAGFNALGAGLIESFDKPQREKAIKLAIDIYNEYTKNNPHYINEGYEKDGEIVLKNIINSSD